MMERSMYVRRRRSSPPLSPPPQLLRSHSATFGPGRDGHVPPIHPRASFALAALPYMHINGIDTTPGPSYHHA